MKFSKLQHQLLKLVRDATSDDGQICFVPKYGAMRCADGEEVIVHGSGVASAFRALQSRGLIEQRPRLGPYAFVVTDAGRTALQ